MQIKIEHLEVKKGTTGKEYKIVQAGEFRASVWGDVEGYNALQVGNTVEVETKTQDKAGKTYINITKAVLVKSEPAVDDTRRSIERQTCLKTACENWAEHLPIDDCLEIADKMFNWLRSAK